MKKIFFSFLMFFACAIGIQAKTIYLNANIWDVDGPAFYVHSWQTGADGSSDLRMSQVAGSIYSVDIPAAHDSVIFMRVNPSSGNFNWEYVWNQTNDLLLGEWGDCFKITCWDCKDGKSGGEWSTYQSGVTDCTESYGLLVDGNYVPGTKNPSPLDPSFNEYQILGVQLTAGQYIQVYDSCSKAAWAISKYANTSYEFPIEDGKYKVTEDGKYDFYFKFKYEADEIYISCTGCKEQPKPKSAVPSECPDVLMQGFYYDSYEVDSTHAGTLQYGDTKWKTLLAQAGEIGAYFDLIWLPPSGFASGVGYHPKQYSNQNSDWGSRTDLEKLIAAFHNSGTKVVADIVINHVEAMASWCDYAVQDFGEYGKFVVDGSYICKNDEINADWAKADSLAGPDCWGTATGKEDDGANWDAARDWSHSEVKVQEMFKAYLKWMRNVIGYDGWRYDKGDGFHNWHMDNYNKASEPYIAFEERYDGNAENLKNGIRDANMNLMALDFALKFDGINAMQGWNYVGRRGLIGKDDTGSDYWKRHAVTWVDNHDMFLRSDNDLEFCGRGNSMKPEIKARLLGANAFILSMPGVPCVFYPHWYKYKEYIKPMIDARHLAGVHSESEVKDEEWDSDGSRATGYKATVVGKNGWLILCLGTKANKQGFGPDYKLIASLYSTFNDNGNLINESYEIWVHPTGDVAPGLIVTPNASFEDKEAGITVTAKATGANAASAKIYYTTDGSDPTTSSAEYTAPLNFKETTTLKIMAVCGSAQSKVQEYTYTYREPLQRGIRVRFNKPAEWNKVYIYAWLPGVDDEGNPTSENIMGAYPGQRIYQDVDGWYSYEFDASMDSVNFCINSGDECGGINVRSNDLVTDYDVCYGWREGKEEESNEEEILECETDLHPAFDLSISPESSFFRDQAEGQQVTISTIGIENAMVYYTLDGSEPTTASQSAPSPVTFTVNQTTTVKAYAVHDKDRTQTKTATYTYKAPQSGPLVVKFQKPDEWTELYLYAFTRVKVGSKYKDTPYKLPGASSAQWPGMKWTTMDGTWNTFTMPANLHEIYVIFTEGKNKPQTQDIYLTETTCYLWNPNCGKAVVDENCDGLFDEGIEEIIDNSHKNHETYKIIYEGRLLIIHNGVMYDVFGRRH